MSHDNVIHFNFAKFTILQSEAAQSRPYEIIDDAVANGPPDSIVASLDAMKKATDFQLSDMPTRETTRKDIWHILLIDAAINSDLLITLLDGTSAKRDEYIFKAVHNMCGYISPEEADLVFAAADSALRESAKRRAS